MSVSTDELVDYIMGDDAPEKVFRCRECGRDFRSAKKAPTLCPECRHASAAENGRIGGKISKGMQTAKAKDEEKILRPAQDDAATVRDNGTVEPEILGTVALTLGSLKRLLDGMGLDDVPITIDGHPVQSLFIEHFYDLANGGETYSIELG